MPDNKVPEDPATDSGESAPVDKDLESELQKLDLEKKKVELELLQSQKTREHDHDQLLSTRFRFVPTSTSVFKGVIAGIGLAAAFFFLIPQYKDLLNLDQEIAEKTIKRDKILLNDDKKRLEKDNKILAEQRKSLAKDKERLEKDNKILAEQRKSLEEDNKRYIAALAELEADQELIVQDLNKEFAKLQADQELIVQDLKKKLTKPPSTESAPITIKLRRDSLRISSVDLHNQIERKGLNLPSASIFGTIQHSYMTSQDEAVVIDQTTKLMWEQSGSDELLTFGNAVAYVDDLNSRGFAGKKKWRIPTMEELISLVEPGRRNGSLYIDPVFNKAQHRIISSDKSADENDVNRHWGIVFYSTKLYRVGVTFPYFVRAVRNLDGT